MSRRQTRHYHNPLQYTCTVLSSTAENLPRSRMEPDYPFSVFRACTQSVQAPSEIGRIYIKGYLLNLTVTFSFSTLSTDFSLAILHSTLYIRVIYSIVIPKPRTNNNVLKQFIIYPQKQSEGKPFLMQLMSCMFLCHDEIVVLNYRN